MATSKAASTKKKSGSKKSSTPKNLAESKPEAKADQASHGPKPPWAHLGAIFGTVALVGLIVLASRGDSPKSGESPGETVNADAAALEKSCDKGDAAACVSLGERIEKVEENKARAAELYQKACDAKNAQGCIRRGKLQLSGALGDRNPTLALSLFAKACAMGSGDGCQEQGAMAASGFGPEKAEGAAAAAAALYKKGCDLKSGAACFALAMMVYNGQGGLEKNDAEALKTFELSCNYGAATGCTGVGRLTLNGKGTAKDPVKGAEFLTKACDGGDGMGCRTLALSYENALELPQDSQKAKQFYQKGCQLGDRMSCTRLNGAGNAAPREAQ